MVKSRNAPFPQSAHYSFCMLHVERNNWSGLYDSPEEVEGFMFQHQAAVACQVQLLQSGRQRVGQLDLSQLITA